jgi:RPA family protein
MSTQSNREVARRVFACEFNAGTYTFRESDDEYAPNYALLPSGERANRIYVVGSLIETADVGRDEEYWQGRVVDPTGAIFVYAGQYQPEPARTLQEIDPPAYVAVVGKPRTYETDDGTVNVAVRPESITVVDEATRDQWVVETAAQTLERLEAFDRATNELTTMARERYEQPVDGLREETITALESLREESSSTISDTPERLLIDNPFAVSGLNHRAATSKREAPGCETCQRASPASHHK